MIDLLLNESFVRSLFPWFAAATPTAALLLYALGLGRGKVGGSEIGKGPDEEISAAEPSSKDGANTASRGVRVLLVCVGLVGPAVWIAWILYETMMNAFGFASVKGLLVVLGLFAMAGLAAGALVSRACRMRKSQ